MSVLTGPRQAGAAFREIFGSALSGNNGYGLTTQAGPDVLRKALDERTGAAPDPQ